MDKEINNEALEMIESVKLESFRKGFEAGASWSPSDNYYKYRGRCLELYIYNERLHYKELSGPNKSVKTPEIVFVNGG